MARKKIKIIKIINKAGLEEIEKEYREPNATEILTWAVNTPYMEIVEDIIKDRVKPWATPLYLIVSEHNPSNGSYKLCREAENYIEKTYGENAETLSISSYMKDTKLRLVILMRSYIGSAKEMVGFFKILGESVTEEEQKFTSLKGKDRKSVV